MGTIQGIYEVGIGTPDLRAQVQYWQQLGYRISAMGQLSARESQALYGVDSALQSLRLGHQEADHGLVRLMAWESPTGPGLGLASMRMVGNRWGTTLTADLLNLLNHLELLTQESPETYRYTEPLWSQIYAAAKSARPWSDPLLGVRESLWLNPLTRHVFFQRFNYELPHYGTVNPHSLLQTSQITHVGLVIQGDSGEVLNFYDQVLGLLRARDGLVDHYEDNPAARPILALGPGDYYYTTDFDDPRSNITELRQVRSGRLKVIRFPKSLNLENKLQNSKPGQLGMSLYTYRIKPILEFWQRVKASTATQVTEIILNEFDEPSFSFVAPDGYFWTLVS
ncbi:VOC family protein [Thermosynechococcaceae cyanobacterium BACA0444]|uniref:VOC family protein n=1 Tax=Pseudocalidococcus azoricus BACA0444 TaxID=2918990 RepID=A0AAE4FUG6_9CYAN|nr:VOC family protein [Pseudocalidococcus azoricus]MDS3861422.1 VOC family protein [Pseudocalidococcus azoricus BACA0444]